VTYFFYWYVLELLDGLLSILSSHTQLETSVHIFLCEVCTYHVGCDNWEETEEFPEENPTRQL